MNDPILEFQREYRFLSNFYPAPFTYKGQEYPSVEHAYQALKCVNKSDHDFIVTSCTPGGAKRHVRKVAQKEGFHDNKLELMSTLVSLKFIYNKDLAKKLLETGDSELIGVTSIGAFLKVKGRIT